MDGSTSQDSPFPRAARSPAWRAWTVLGWSLLALWAFVWISSLHHNYLRGGRHTYVPWYPKTLGIDYLNNYFAAHHWLDGGNPFTEAVGDPLDRKFCYPPPVLAAFAWSRLFEPLPAIWINFALLTLVGVVAAVAVWRTRNHLGLWEAPLPWILAAFLWSTPALYALERGNYDLLVAPFLLGAAWGLERRSARGDAIAGTCLAIAAWLKLYPALIGAILLAMRRWRAIGVCAVVGLAIGAASLPYLMDFFANARELEELHRPKAFDVSAHTLSAYWPLYWTGRRLEFLARIPGTVVSLAVVIGMIGVVSYRVSRCPNPGPVLFPLFLWVTALATLVPKVSNDYNLVFFPLAALAVWDRRDSVAVHIAMGFSLLWWQPYQLPIGPQLLFLFKLAGLAGVGCSLLARVRALTSATEKTESTGQESPPGIALAA